MYLITCNPRRSVTFTYWFPFYFVVFVSTVEKTEPMRNDTLKTFFSAVTLHSHENWQKLVVFSIFIPCIINCNVRSGCGVGATDWLRVHSSVEELLHILSWVLNVYAEGWGWSHTRPAATPKRAVLSLPLVTNRTSKLHKYLVLSYR